MKKYKIDSEEIDPGSLYLSVDIQADAPFDQLQRINGAVMMSKELQVPARLALEHMGVTDPHKLADEWSREQMFKAELAGIVQRIQMEASGELEQLIQQRAQELVQQQMEQQQAAAQAQAQAAPPQDPNAQGMMGEMANPADPTGGMGGGGATGMGFAPGMGGSPPMQAGVGMMGREQATGLTASGRQAGS